MENNSSKSNNNGLENFSGDNAQDLLPVDSLNDLPHQERDKHELDDRNNLYTKVLNIYSNHINASLEANASYKKMVVYSFFGIIILIFAGVIGTIIFISIARPPEITSVLSILTVLISLVSAIIVIPKRITEYLFNLNETAQVGEVIKNIQTYDIAIRKDLYKYTNNNHPDKSNKL